MLDFQKIFPNYKCYDQTPCLFCPGTMVACEYDFRRCTLCDKYYLINWVDRINVFGYALGGILNKGTFGGAI